MSHGNQIEIHSFNNIGQFINQAGFNIIFGKTLKKFSYRFGKIEFYYSIFKQPSRAIHRLQRSFKIPKPMLWLDLSFAPKQAIVSAIIFSLSLNFEQYKVADDHIQRMRWMRKQFEAQCMLFCHRVQCFVTLFIALMNQSAFLLQMGAFFSDFILQTF